MNSNAHFRHYIEQAAAGEPVLPHCESCQAVFMPPRAACPECGTAKPGWVPAQGASGIIYSFTVVESRDGARVVGLAELDMITDGSKFYANVVNVAPTDVAVGQRVRIDTEAITGEGARVPVLVAGGGAR